MRVLVQRVRHARVTVEERVIGAIERGLLVFVGVGRNDTDDEAEWLARRVAGLRIFEDEAGKMNRTVSDIGGAVLAVPQFTLYGDCRRGRRPDFTQAAPPEDANRLFSRFCEMLSSHGLSVSTGAFREHMHVQLENDGPVTLWVTRERRGKTLVD